jgi:hypothetical protein
MKSLEAAIIVEVVCVAERIGKRILQNAAKLRSS